MSVRIGSARIDERGKATGGAAGDNNGREVSTQDYYVHAKGWRVFRAKDKAVAEKIAQAMEWACANDAIGYDQAQRNTLWNDVKSKNYDPRKTSKKVETDCSALVRLCCAYAGVVMSDFVTSTEADRLRASGAFTELKDAMYTDGSAYLQRGDILVTRTKGHTVVVLSNGSKAAPVAETKECVRIIGSSVFVRKGNGTRYASVAIVYRGDKLPWVATAANGWYAVEVDGLVGWVSGKYCVLDA